MSSITQHWNLRKQNAYIYLLNHYFTQHQVSGNGLVRKCAKQKAKHDYANFFFFYGHNG